MDSLTLRIDQGLDQVATLLDRCRQTILRASLQSQWLRHVYGGYRDRLLAIVVLSTVAIFPIAIWRPAFLLFFGPLVFGYPHLIASYRFLSTNKSSRLFAVFCLMTALTVFFFQWRMQFSQLPFGVFQQGLATSALFVAYFLGFVKNKISLFLGVIIAAGSALLAWREPLIYGGGVLMLHNWTAYLHWITNCPRGPRRHIAYFAAILFGAIHAIVLMGALDLWMPVERLHEWHIDGTAWFLATWSQNPVVWYRCLVLYTFGLSMHYVIWLRAIPEATLTSEAPSCFRLSLRDLRADVGRNTLLALIALALAGLGIWMINLPLGQLLYFQIALLHGSLEVAFWPTKLVRSS